MPRRKSRSQKNKSRTKSKSRSKSRSRKSKSRSRKTTTGGAKSKVVLEYYALGGCPACVGIDPYWNVYVETPDFTDLGLSFIKHEVYRPSVALPDVIDSLVDGFPYWTVQGYPDYVIPREYYRDPVKLLGQLAEWNLIDKYTDVMADRIMKVFTGKGLNVGNQF